VVPPRAAPPQIPLETKLLAQKAGEDIADFLDRARAFFQLANVGDAHRALHVVHAAQPEVSRYAASMLSARDSTYAELTAALLKRFGKNVFGHYDEFVSSRMHGTESVLMFAGRIETTFGRALALSPADQVTHRSVMDKVLIQQLVRGLPGPVADQVRTQVLRFPDLTWDAVVQFADTAHGGASVRAAGRKTGFPASATGTCALHGPLSRHTDAECRGRGTSGTPSPGVGSGTAYSPAPHRCRVHGPSWHSDADCRDQMGPAAQFPLPSGPNPSAGYRPAPRPRQMRPSGNESTR
jgi:hypothetical protein